MALLADYAITPDVFDVMSYPNEEVCEARLELIREPMLTEGWSETSGTASGAGRSRTTRELGIIGAWNSLRSWPRKAG